MAQDMKSALYVMEQHDQLLQIWRSQNAMNLHLAHLDFHCDMRGLLIDRPAQRAYRIHDRHAGVDEGNFLTHAIDEGRIRRIRWIHDVPGGRRDDVGTVKYESDWSVQLMRRRLKRKGKLGIPLAYEVMTFPQWAGLEEGEFLSIDWDVFACKDYPAHTIDARIEAFFERDFMCTPAQVSLCYSPNYSHPTRPKFEQFVQRIADMLQVKIIRTPVPPPKPPSIYKRILPRPLYGVLRTAYDQSNRWLHRQGIY